MSDKFWWYYRRGICVTCHKKPAVGHGVNNCRACDLKSAPEQLKKLQEGIGVQAVRSLRRGGILHIWRRSSPHNWWVAPKRDENHFYWHSGEYGFRPSLSMFELIGHSAEKVSYGLYIPGGFRGSDDGSPEHSRYRLRKVFR
jgi:hypothetical protein